MDDNVLLHQGPVANTHLIDDEISAVRRIAGDVADGPDGLLLNVLGRRPEKLDENGDSSGVDDHPRLRGGAAGDVGQRPSGLELKRRVVGGPEKLDESGNDS